MLYKKRKRFNAKQIDAMRHGKDRARMDRTLEPRPPIRRNVLCERWTRQRLDAAGNVTEECVCECYGTTRVDSFRVFKNGEQQPRRIGASRIAVLLRGVFPRVLSERNL